MKKQGTLWIVIVEWQATRPPGVGRWVSKSEEGGREEGSLLLKNLYYD